MSQHTRVIRRFTERVTGYSVKCLPERHKDLGRGNYLTQGPMIGASVIIEVDGRTQIVPSLSNERSLINENPTEEMIREVTADLMRSRPFLSECQFDECRKRSGGKYYRFAREDK